MPFQSSDVYQYDQLKTVGIAIHWDADHAQMHVGVLHRLNDDIKFCHLKFHNALARETPLAGYFWADCEMFFGGEGRRGRHPKDGWCSGVAFCAAARLFVQKAVIVQSRPRLSANNGLMHRNSIVIRSPRRRGRWRPQHWRQRR